MSINPHEVNVKVILIMKVQFLLPQCVLRSHIRAVLHWYVGVRGLLLTHSLVRVIELNFQDHQLSYITVGSYYYSSAYLLCL